MSSNEHPKVSICVVTFNHEKYIENCLQSVLNQKVDFDFEVIVGDDVSSDETRSIIKKISDANPGKLTLIFNEKNIGASQNYRSVHSMARGQYVAHLDGDDYLLPGKLQAQVDCLDGEPNCNIVWHRMKVLNDKTNSLFDDLYDETKLCDPRFFRPNLLEFGSIACHSSKMYRNNALTVYPDRFIDFYLDIEHVGLGYARYLNEFYGVYRASVGISSNSSGWVKGLYLQHLNYFLKKHPEYRAQIGANAILRTLGDLKNRRSSWRDFFWTWIRCHSILSIRRFARNYPLYRMFRAPKIHE